MEGSSGQKFVESFCFDKSITDVPRVVFLSPICVKMEAREADEASRWVPVFSGCGLQGGSREAGLLSASCFLTLPP